MKLRVDPDKEETLVHASLLFASLACWITAAGTWDLLVRSLGGGADNAHVYPYFYKPFYQWYLITGRAKGPADGSVAF